MNGLRHEWIFASIGRCFLSYYHLNSSHFLIYKLWNKFKCTHPDECNDISPWLLLLADRLIHRHLRFLSKRFKKFPPTNAISLITYIRFVFLFTRVTFANFHGCCTNQLRTLQVCCTFIIFNMLENYFSYQIIYTTRQIDPETARQTYVAGAYIL